VRRGRENIFHFPTAAEAIKISNCKYAHTMQHTRNVYKSLKLFCLVRATAIMHDAEQFNMCNFTIACHRHRLHSIARAARAIDNNFKKGLHSCHDHKNSWRG
jgi:hypothetical protein